MAWASTWRARSARIPSAMRAALRFAIAMPIMRAAILRAWAFFFFASAVWGLLPLVVREGLGLGPVGFGLMLGTAGGGAVLAGLALPALREYLSPGKLVLAASLVAYAAMALLGLGGHWVPSAFAMLLFGAGWLAAGTTLGAVAQMTAPAWARARALGVFQLSCFGAQAIGSAVWGAVGSQLSMPTALVLCAGTGALAALVVRPWRFSAFAPAIA